jgi:hypothetical protein
MSIASSVKERNLANAEAQAHAITQAHTNALDLPPPQWPVVGYDIEIPIQPQIQEQNEQNNFFEEGIEVY